MNSQSKKQVNRPPEFIGNLRKNLIRVPHCIEEHCSGIRVLGKLLKSLIFSTDVAIIRNCNADAVIAVYPFTPQPIITHAITLVADKPVFCGIGGGLTSGRRSLEIAIDAEFQGAMGVVVNKPTPNSLIEKLKMKIEIPVILTVVNEEEDFPSRIAAGVDIFNVSGAARTPEIIKKIHRIKPDMAIIATGGKTNETILAAIHAGAHAISWTPPSTAELFKDIMSRYRDGKLYGDD